MQKNFNAHPDDNSNKRTFLLNVGRLYVSCYIPARSYVLFKRKPDRNIEPGSPVYCALFRQRYGIAAFMGKRTISSVSAVIYRKATDLYAATAAGGAGRAGGALAAPGGATSNYPPLRTKDSPAPITIIPRPEPAPRYK
ncbi:hypothetical protein EVAR_4809_1 [Eumeta japonica]|uniref:Uncharacterized protein n=1 Tax=Eumeta variegata TaxID=151549 RepID=A0A4C1T1V9_EUMVA|nr:hypothetical protein EVAR_4809_1 [Eumeta japonica]